MRAFSADYVFPVSGSPIKNGIIILDESNVIIDVVTNLESLPEYSDLNLKTFEGIICPGFVNAHCHLELSHMKSVIPEKTGLAGFIKNFVAARGKFSEQEISSAIEKAESEMLQNGIVAVGDISNTLDSFPQKKKDNLRYHTFLESFDLVPANTEKETERIKTLATEIKTKFPDAMYSLAPHAPYSVTKELYKFIESFNPGSAIISIHNQESEEENKLFLKKEGALIELFTSIGLDFSLFESTGKRSLPSYLKLLSGKANILLVHNTFTSPEDIRFAHSCNKNTFWCTCPNANLYIENKLPNYNLFIKENAKMCIGTDSYASNHQLSILEEMKTISTNFPMISLGTLLEWATLNGAKALGFQDNFGSFEKGKNPGLVLIENVDLENFALIEKSAAKRIA